jgi:hypothetical protein
MKVKSRFHIYDAGVGRANTGCHGAVMIKCPSGATHVFVIILS